MRGAALRGLARIRPTEIVAKRHYGWSIHKSFREGVDDEEDVTYSKWDGSKRCSQRMTWAVKKVRQLECF